MDDRSEPEEFGDELAGELERESGARGGRPTLYTRALADEVLLLIAVDEQSLRSACDSAGVKPGTFCGWVVDDVDGLAERYLRAKKIRAHQRFDELIEISDDATAEVARSALKVSTRQWVLARMLRNEFGDKIELDASDKLTAAFSGACDKLAGLLGGEGPESAAEGEAESAPQGGEA